jgi:Tol biopolymer transport system component
MSTQKIKPNPDALERQPTRQRRRSVGKKVGALAVAAAISLAAVVLILATRAGETTTTSAQEPPRVASGIASGPFLLNLRTGERTPLPEDLVGGFDYRASPDGRRVAYGTCCDAADSITVADLEGTEFHQFTPTKGPDAYGPQWSPDGTKLVYQERNAAVEDSVGNLFIGDVFRDRRTQLTDLELSHAWWWFLSPSFSPDGRKVIFHMPRGSSATTKWDVWSVPVTGGEPTLVLRNAAFPLYIPDRREIAFVEPTSSNFEGYRIAIANADGHDGGRRTLVEAGDLIWWPAISPDGSRIVYRVGDYSLHVVDVSTGASSEVADGENADWVDDDTLIVNPR